MNYLETHEWHWTDTGEIVLVKHLPTGVRVEFL